MTELRGTIRSIGPDDRGVSQTVGFVLIFGILITSVGIVSTIGFDQLDTIRQNEQDRNAQRGMDLLAQNFEEIHQGQTTVRSGEFEITQGSLGTLPESQSAIRVLVSDTSGPQDDYEERIPLNALVYSFDDTAIAYEGGAVVRRDQGGAILHQQPSFVCTEKQALVSVVTIDTDGQRQVGEGSVTTRLRKNESTIRFPMNRTGENSTQGRANVTIEIDSEFDEAWARHLDEDTEWDSVGSLANNKFACEGPSGNGVGTYRVVQTRINLSYVR